MNRNVKDSTLYRIARDVGFNARVEPIWYSYGRLRARMGFFERWREKRRIRKLLSAVGTELRARGANPNGWEDRPGECVCNLRVARAGLVAELQNYLRDRLSPEEFAPWKHLMAQRDRNAYILPVDFADPFDLPSKEGPGPTGFTSARRVAANLVEVNRALRIDETFALAKAKKVDYMDATERDISAYESRFGTMEGFWAKFAYVLLKKLSETAIEKKLPVIFA